CDHLGTPMALTDQTGQVAWAAKLDPWGNVLQEYNPQGIHQAIRLPGQHHDRETGLYYNRHRYYDPVVGSYINQDPIGLMGGNNHYIYPVNPTGWIDSLGLQQACVVNFPDYPVEYAEGKTSTWLGGHSGVLTYDTSGKTQYFEYGRYNPNAKGIMGSKLPQDDGNVRQTPMPNLKIGKDGVPTDDSMRNLEEQLSKRSGKGTPAKLTCSSADPKKVADYAKEISENKDREKYNWNPFNSNHCRTFARDAAKAGQ
ncbi:RHS repeat-associated core domain-containing protein, partial [Delftia sp. 13_1_20CM_4_67_18]|uniref:RHS repeat-associated core domain-containing protein n=1 Tax=Delftia sp. 13_1_20CM_4_67_18 TaxID=1805105 RepID=UPI000B15DCA8